MGILYLVATPIGNLEDISARALRVLREARLIAAEDTRHTGKLLSHFQISTPQTSYYEHNKLQKLDTVLAALAEGDVALVSDAGTPGLNDPGYELVRAALDAGYPVSPIPGPSAPVSALVASGLPTDSFLYLGYLPRRTNQRRELLSRVRDDPYTLLFLESPHRVLDTLHDLIAVLGDRQAAVARELTKLHEEIFRGSLREAHAYFEEKGARGEFTLVVAGRQEEAEPWTEERVIAALRAGAAEGEAPSRLAARISSESGWSRRKVYRLLTDL